MRVFVCMRPTDMRKSFEAGTFQVPAGDADAVELDAAELSMLLSGIDLSTARRRKRYRRAS